MSGQLGRDEVKKTSHRWKMGEVRLELTNATHGNPNVGPLQSDAVVDPVAGHPDDVVLLLQGLDYPELVPRGHSVKHGHSFDQRLESLVVHVVHVFAGEARRVGRGYPERLRYRHCRVLAVTFNFRRGNKTF